MTKTIASSAVIYCRVSDTKQKTLGDGLNSQQTRCREYAKYKGYAVTKVFEDDASGSLIDRPGMKSMLAFLWQNKQTPHVVIIDDISRLARGLETHLQLRAAIASAGGVLESPSIEFGEDSDSILVENLLASVSQHQRQKNGEQTKNRMRARMMNGYWVHRPPVGYRFQRVAGHNKLLVRDEPNASILQEALEGYASGRFQLQAEVQRFLESHPAFPYIHNGRIHSQRIVELLTREIYAGYVGEPKWDVPLRKGHHEGLISLATFERIQQRMKEGARVPARSDVAHDFPLRGAVVCGDCCEPLTAGWSTGRSASYPYYLCKKRGCVAYGKSIRRDKIEGEFAALLRALTPSKALFDVAEAMFRDLWQHRLTAGETLARTLRLELAKVDTQIEQFLDRLADANGASIISAYENRIRKLEGQKLLLAEKAAQSGRPLRSFDSALRTALSFLGAPSKLWASGRFEDQRMVLKLAFAERLTYCRKTGFRTVDLALPFKTLANFSTGKNEMVGGAGLEPATPAV